MWRFARRAWLLGAAATVYAAWMAFGLYWRYPVGAATLLQQGFVGLLIGVIAAGLCAYTQRGILVLAVSVVGYGLWALAHQQPIALHLAQGSVLGALMWLFEAVPQGSEPHEGWRYFVAVLVCIGGLFAAPLIAVRLYDGQLYLVVAFGTRIVAGLLLHYLPVRAGGVLFGVALGIAGVAVSQIQ
ncbi:MAG: hypothetical protein ACOYL5_07975 [Phototrophicaceae bacterium]